MFFFHFRLGLWRSVASLIEVGVSEACFSLGSILLNVVVMSHFVQLAEVDTSSGLFFSSICVSQEILESWFASFWRFASISCCVSGSFIHQVG
jgi:hypothetical protein